MRKITKIIFWWGRRFFPASLSRLLSSGRVLEPPDSNWTELVKIFSRHRKERTFFRLGQTNYGVLDVQHSQQRRCCCSRTKTEKRLCALCASWRTADRKCGKSFETWRDSPACCYSFGRDPPNGKSLGWKTWRAKHFLFILGLAQLKFKSIAMIFVDVLMNNFGRNTNSVYFQEIVLFLLK